MTYSTPLGFACRRFAAASLALLLAVATLVATPLAAAAAGAEVGEVGVEVFVADVDGAAQALIDAGSSQARFVVPPLGPGAQPFQVELIVFKADRDGLPGERLIQLFVDAGEILVVVDPGCYVFSWSTIGPYRWVKTDVALREFRFCAEPDGFMSADLGLRFRSPGGGLPERQRGDVRTFSGRPVPGVEVNYFRAVEGVSNEQLRSFDEDDHRAIDYRGRWIHQTTTDADGYFSTVPEPLGDCLVQTLTAPEGFEFNGDRFTRRTSCPGFYMETIAMEAESGSAAIEGEVLTESGSSVAGVVIDLYSANGDGSRGIFARGKGTDNGAYRFQVEPGCYVIVQIAPDDYLLSATKSKYHETALCVDKDGTQRVDGVLIQM